MRFSDSDFLAYGDESGTASLKAKDAKHPVFALVFCLFKVSDYVDEVVPRVQRLKIKYFGHDQVVLHSNELRHGHGAFKELPLGELESLQAEVDEVSSELPMTVIAGVLDKRALRASSDLSSLDPGNLAQGWCAELIMRSVEQRAPTDSTGQINLVAEAISAKQDRRMRQEFESVRAGTAPLSVRALPGIHLQFAKKETNSTGMQLADWAARPIARHALDPEETNPVWDLIAKRVGATGAASLPDMARFKGAFLKL